MMNIPRAWIFSASLVLLAAVVGLRAFVAFLAVFLFRRARDFVFTVLFVVVSAFVVDLFESGSSTKDEGNASASPKSARVSQALKWVDACILRVLMRDGAADWGDTAAEVATAQHERTAQVGAHVTNNKFGSAAYSSTREYQSQEYGAVARGTREATNQQEELAAPAPQIYRCQQWRRQRRRKGGQRNGVANDGGDRTVVEAGLDESSADCLRQAWQPEGVADEVCREAGTLVDILLRDYITPWFGSLSADAEFPGDVQDLLIFAVGRLLHRIRVYLNPVEFTLHKGTFLLRHHLVLYGNARREARRKHPEAFQDVSSGVGLHSSAAFWFSPFSSHGTSGVVGDERTVIQSNGSDEIGRNGRTVSELVALPAEANANAEAVTENFRNWCASQAEATAYRNRLIAQELIDSGFLHPAFTWSDKGSVRDAKVEVDVETGPEAKPSEHEMAYLRFVANHLINYLLDKVEGGCEILRHLARELVVASIMVPIVNLVSSDNINNWILLYFRSAQAKSNKDGGPKGSSSSSSSSSSPSTSSSSSSSTEARKEEETSAPTAMAASSVDIEQEDERSRSHDVRRQVQHLSDPAANGAKYSVVGVPPVNVRPTRDRAWKHLVGAKDEVAAEILLNGERLGTFLLRKIPDAMVSSSSSSGAAATFLPSSPESASLGDIYALSYVCARQRAKEQPHRKHQQQRFSNMNDMATNGMVSKRHEWGELQVMHILLRCSPGRFQYQGVARPDYRKEQQNVAHDPKLLERASTDLMKTYPTLSSLLANGLDGICTNGLEFDPEEDEDVDFWAKVEAEEGKEKAMQILAEEDQKEAEKLMSQSAAGRPSEASENALRRFSDDEDDEDDDDEEDDDDHDEDEDVNIVSAFGEGVDGDVRLGEMLGRKNGSGTTFSIDSQADGQSASAAGGGDGVRAHVDSTDKAELLAAKEMMETESNKLFQEQQRHVLLIELQAAIDNLEDYHRRCRRLKEHFVERQPDLAAQYAFAASVPATSFVNYPIPVPGSFYAAPSSIERPVGSKSSSSSGSGKIAKKIGRSVLGAVAGAVSLGHAPSLTGTSGSGVAGSGGRNSEDHHGNGRNPHGGGKYRSGDGGEAGGEVGRRSFDENLAVAFDGIIGDNSPGSVAFRPWAQPEAITHIARIVTALDAVFSYGFKASMGYEHGVMSAADAFSEEDGEGMEGRVSFLQQRRRNTRLSMSGTNGPGSNRELPLSSKSRGPGDVSREFRVDDSGDGGEYYNTVAMESLKNSEMQDYFASPADKSSSFVAEKAMNMAEKSQGRNESDDHIGGRDDKNGDDDDVYLYHAYLLCELDNSDEATKGRNAGFVAEALQDGENAAEGTKITVSCGTRLRPKLQNVDAASHPRKQRTTEERLSDYVDDGMTSNKSGESSILLRDIDPVFGATAAVLDACSSPLSAMLFDAGVDLAGRSWIVSALAEGVLEDRLYALAANPRRTRAFYEPNAVLREPNDSSRLLWLIERLSAIDFGAHTRARHAFPTLPIVVKSLGEGQNAELPLLAHRVDSLLAEASLAYRTNKKQPQRPGGVSGMQSPGRNNAGHVAKSAIAPPSNRSLSAFSNAKELLAGANEDNKMLRSDAAVSGMKLSNGYHYRFLGVYVSQMERERKDRSKMSSSSSSSSSSIATASASSMFKSALRTIDSALTFSSGSNSGYGSSHQYGSSPKTRSEQQALQAIEHNHRGAGTSTIGEKYSNDRDPSQLLVGFPSSPPSDKTNGVTSLGNADNAKSSSSSYMVPGVKEGMGVLKSLGTAVGGAADSLVVAPVVAAAELTKAAAREARDFGNAAFDFRAHQRAVASAAAAAAAAARVTTGSSSSSSSTLSSTSSSKSKNRSRSFSRNADFALGVREKNLTALSRFKYTHPGNESLSGGSTAIVSEKSRNVNGKKNLQHSSHKEPSLEGSRRRKGNPQSMVTLKHAHDCPPEMSRSVSDARAQRICELSKAATALHSKIMILTARHQLQKAMGSYDDAASIGVSKDVTKRPISSDSNSGAEILGSETGASKKDVVTPSGLYIEAKYLDGFHTFDSATYEALLQGDESLSSPVSKQTSEESLEVEPASNSSPSVVFDESPNATVKSKNGQERTFYLTFQDIAFQLHLSHVLLDREEELSSTLPRIAPRPHRKVTKRRLEFLLKPTRRSTLLELKKRYIYRTAGSTVKANVVFSDKMHTRHGNSPLEGVSAVSGTSVSPVGFSPSSLPSSSSCSPLLSPASVGSNDEPTSLDNALDDFVLVDEVQSSRPKKGKSDSRSSAVFYEIQVAKVNIITRVVVRWKVKRRFNDFTKLHAALVQESGPRTLPSNVHHTTSSVSHKGATGPQTSNSSAIDERKSGGSAKGGGPMEEAVRRKSNDYFAHVGTSTLHVGSMCDMQLPSLPPKKILGNTERDFVATRRRKLSEYLDRLVRHPVWGGCHELLVFLDAMRDREDAPSDQSNGWTAAEMSLKRSRAFEKHVNEQFNEGTQTATLKKSGAVALSQASFEIHRNGFVQEKTIDDRILRTIQQQLYSILKELFDIDRTNVLRRNLVSFLRKAVKIIFTDTISRSIQDQAVKVGSDMKTASFLHWLVRTIWCSKGMTMRQPLRENWPSKTLQQQRQLKVRTELLGAVPGTFSSLMGQTTCDGAVFKLFEFLQCAIIVRSFLYSALDLLWKQLFPEMREHLCDLEQEWETALRQKNRGH